MRLKDKVAVATGGGRDIARMIDTIITERGRVDILVNNAMKIVPGKLEALPEAAWDTTMNIGHKGAFLVSQAVGYFLSVTGRRFSGGRID